MHKGRNDEGNINKEGQKYRKYTEKKNNIENVEGRKQTRRKK
jgi:hypothetical protein